MLPLSRHSVRVPEIFNNKQRHSSAAHPSHATPQLATMRYDDWDVILFPAGRDSKIPFKEFRVACHVVPDLELAHIHGAVGVPVMTCFVPSLPAHAAFQVSIHYWRRPEISQFTRTYSKHAELVKFEARVLLDGRLVASSVLDRDINGPHLITSSFEFTKTGELERLKFPPFRRELLQQNHWHPGDDLGRIKIIISEGFPRDSLSVPIERVKNVVAFSFQHAPLEMLESNGIAWPNPSMWRRPTPNPAMPVPTYHPDTGADSHAHSPGRRGLLLRNINNQGFPVPPMASNMFQTQANAGIFGSQPLQMPYLGRSNAGTGNALAHLDPFPESAYREWVNAMTGGQTSDIWEGRAAWATNTRIQSRQQNSDTVMADYVSPQSSSDPMQISGSSLEEDPMSLKVPTNTPTGGNGEDLHNAQFQLPQTAQGMHADFASSLTQSLLNQPLPFPIPPQNLSLPLSELQSRKENRHTSLSHTSAALAQTAALAESTETRKLSQSLFGIGGPEAAASVPAEGSEQSTSAALHSMFATGSHNPLNEFGTDITNTSGKGGGVASGGPAQSASEINDNGLPSSLGITGGADGGGSVAPKRTRNFTPASAKAIDEEDEPRRVSPHVRIAGFGGGETSGDGGQC